MPTIENKITDSITLIRKGERLALALNPTDGYFVGFSGGKDSQVLLELVKMANVKFKAYYNVTTNDPPDNVYFIRNNYPEVVFIHPKDNFFKLVEKKGLPTRKRRFCCIYLKENTGTGNVVLTGVRAEESNRRASYNEIQINSRRKEHADRSRKRTIEEIEQNEHRCIKGKDKLMVYPILHWTNDEVWQFIHDRHLPINPCYEKFNRVGCMFCPFSSKAQIEHYEMLYPKFKYHLINAMDIFLSRNPQSSGLTAQEYYEWWISKRSMKQFRSEQRQLSINFEKNYGRN